MICRWNEVMRKIELWTEIEELNYQGEWSAVEVQPKQDVPSAGVFQLQQVSLMRSGITGRSWGGGQVSYSRLVSRDQVSQRLRYSHPQITKTGI